MKSLTLRLVKTTLILTACLFPVQAFGQGIFLPAGGAVNRGMGGATTGTAIEAIGSMYWNPATISALPTNEMAFGFEAIYTNYELSSSFPGVGAGATEAEIGATPVPTIAWVYHTANPDVTFGLGIFGVAGFATNVRADATNPITSPAFALGGVGVGGIKSEAIFFQMNPALSYKLTDRLSVGGGPVIGIGKIALDENVFAGLNADLTYPRGDGTRYHWGLGAQLGLHYVHNSRWEFGTNVKTPTWFEPFRYFGEDAAGLPRTDEVDVTLPLIVSGGVAFKGLPCTLLTADVRYLNYVDSEAFGDPAAYEADGRVSGLGYRDQFSVGLGAQFDLTEKLVGRLGYIYASDLINDADTFFNIASDLSYRHVPSIGATYHLSQSTSVSFAYNYLIKWGSTGPYVLPVLGAIPGSSVTTEFDAHILSIGANVRY
jgi:long-chain fatty acid transport protein